MSSVAVRFPATKLFNIPFIYKIFQYCGRTSDIYGYRQTGTNEITCHSKVVTKSLQGFFMCTVHK